MRLALRSYRTEFEKAYGKAEGEAIGGWAERQHRKILADFKALAEAIVPAHA